MIQTCHKFGKYKIYLYYLYVCISHDKIHGTTSPISKDRLFSNSGVLLELIQITGFSKTNFSLFKGLQV